MSDPLHMPDTTDGKFNAPFPSASSMAWKRSDEELLHELEYAKRRGGEASNFKSYLVIALEELVELRAWKARLGIEKLAAAIAWRCAVPFDGSPERLKLAQELLNEEACALVERAKEKP